MGQAPGWAGGQEDDVGDFLESREMHDRKRQTPLIVVVERRILMQTCLLRLLERELADFSIMGVETTSELIRAAGQDIRLVVLHIGDRSVADADVAKDHAGIREMFPQALVVVISDRDDEATAHQAIQCGFRGFFPTSISVEVAIAGFRLVLAGGISCPPLISLRRDGPYSGGSSPSGSTSGPSQDGPKLNGLHHDVDLCPVASLTPREKGVLEELQLGYSNKVIARNLGLSENTVKMHIQHLMRKLGARTRTEAVFIWSRAISISERPSGVPSQ